jgi:hypothetical protein
MASLVLELQSECLSETTSVTAIMRKALVVGIKLNQSDFINWINAETEGYGEKDKVPAYRIIHGSPVVWNPYHGWTPIVADEQVHAKLSKRALGVRVSELETMALKKDGSFTMTYPPKTEAQLMRSFSVKLQPVLKVDPTTFVGVLESIRTVVLNWALQLEKDGILGENMTFSEREVQAAQAITINVGQLHNSQLQVGSPGSTQVQNNETQVDLDSLHELIAALENVTVSAKLDQAAISELRAEISTLKAQVSSPKPKVGIVAEAVKSARNIVEGAASGLLNAGLLALMGKNGA